MWRPLRFSVVLLTTFGLLPATLFAQPFASELVGFDGPPFDDPATSREMFQSPQASGSTDDFMIANSAGAYDNNASFRASGFQTAGDAAMNIFFTWVDPFDPNSWVRVTTFNGPERPNPTLDLTGKVKFKITNISGFTGSIGLCLGVRETGVDAPQLADGGSVGTIEWVGVDTTPNGIIAGADMFVDTVAAGDDVQEYPFGADLGPDGLNLPTGTAVISPGGNGVIDTAPAGDDEIRFGYFISDTGARVPIPAVTLAPAPVAKAIEFDLANGTIKVDTAAPVGGIAGMTGDGVLGAAFDRGTLEHIALVNVAGDFSSLISVHIDELQFFANTPDPTPPPVIVSPVFEGANVSVQVQASADATVVELFLNDGSQGTQVPNASDIATFTIPTLVAGDILTATQTANGEESPLSAPVIVFAEGVIMADSFDSYNTQADLNVFWTDSVASPSPEDAKLLLQPGGAASCPNFLREENRPAPMRRGSTARSAA